jgi:hypothetical protein
MKLNIVPARTGLLWVKLGIQTFLKQPLAMAGLVFLYSAAAGLLLLVPLAGPLLMLALVPTVTLGLMAATKLAEERKFPMPTILLTAFRTSRERVRSMLVLGVLYAACLFVLMMAIFLLVDVPVADKTPAEVFESQEFQVLAAWIGLLYLPISLMFWHAPALVHWHGVPPLKSLFFSFVACIRNAGAFAVYGLAWVAMALAIVILALIAGAVSPPAAGMVLGAGTTLATVAFYTSIWFTFRDSFLDSEDNPGEPL